MRRLGLLVVAVACLLVASERPAAAHGAGGIEATNFEPTLDGLTPGLTGVRARLIETGTRLELRNDGPEAVVLGVDGEPYLRVGPEGAFENRRSRTVAANKESSHELAAASTADPPAATTPEWRKVSDAPVVRWHDHRTHWEGPRDPPEVERAPGERHVVYPRWEVPVVQGEARAVVFGRLTWVPGPSPAPWFGLMAACFLGVGLLGLLRRWGPPLAAATAVLLAVDVVHAASVAFASAGGIGSQLGRLVTGSFYGIIGWVLAVAAVRLLRRGRVDGLYAAVFAGLSIAVFGGLLDLTILSRTFTPFALPTGVARLCVALAAGGGLGLAAASLLVIQRTPDARRVVGSADEQSAGDTVAERQERLEPGDGAGPTEPERPGGGVGVGGRPPT